MDILVKHVFSITESSNNVFQIQAPTAALTVELPAIVILQGVSMIPTNYKKIK